MKRLIAVVLALVVAVSFAGCGLFNDDSIVKFEDIYTHKDPDGLKYDERKTMINKNFGPDFEDTINADAYPSTLKFDNDGNMIGIYVYDEETGMASGYMDLLTGEFVEEEVNLGKPDESKMTHLAGSVILGCVIYGAENHANAAYLYAFMSDKADTETVKANMELYYGWTMEKESDTVLVCKQDEAAIGAKFQEWQDLYGQIQSDRSVSGYASNLSLDLGLKNYGVNPYKACESIVDPEDIDFDERILLTSNGTYSFADSSLEKDMIRTDVVYGKDGHAIAHFIYYEYKTKDAADKLMNSSSDNFFDTPIRISDTIIQDRITGQDFQDVIKAYIGYNVMTDDALESYADNLEATYNSMRYDQ